MTERSECRVGNFPGLGLMDIRLRRQVVDLVVARLDRLIVHHLWVSESSPLRIIIRLPQLLVSNFYQSSLGRVQFIAQVLVRRAPFILFKVRIRHHVTIDSFIIRRGHVCLRLAGGNFIHLSTIGPPDPHTFEVLNVL